MQQATDTLTPFERELIRRIAVERAGWQEAHAAYPLTYAYCEARIETLNEIEAWARGFLDLAALDAPRVQSMHRIGRLAAGR